MWYASTGYDANGGFYTEQAMEAKPVDSWIDYPQETQERLRKLTIMEDSFWKRLKFLFTKK